MDGSFQLFMPQQRTTSVVFASPHSGKDYPDHMLRRSVLDRAAIRSSEDAFVDRLFDLAPVAGAPFLVATAPRAYVDLNRACDELDPPTRSLLMIENVGNLVCPALFDLGEAAKVVIISVTEGDDKPLKYPNMFAEAELCLINKIDLLPYVDFDVARCREAALTVNPGLEILELSATTGEGLDTWIGWLRARVET